MKVILKCLALFQINLLRYSLTNWHATECFVACVSAHMCIVSRCYAALGDVAKARYLREVGKLADKIHTETVSTHSNCRTL